MEEEGGAREEQRVKGGKERRGEEGREDIS